MEVDKEQVEFIESLFSDGSKTWEQRFDAIIEWRKKNRGLRDFHVSLMPTIDGSKPDIEKVAEELCRMSLESAKGELKEVDVTDEPL